MHAPLAGALPFAHKLQIVLVVASHFMHPLTVSKHSLPVVVLDDFVQAVLAVFRSYPVLHVVQVVEVVQVLQLSMHVAHTNPFKKL